MFRGSAASREKTYLAKALRRKGFSFKLLICSSCFAALRLPVKNISRKGAKTQRFYLQLFIILQILRGSADSREKTISRKGAKTQRFYH
jgi:hypothetical protein